MLTSPGGIAARRTKWALKVAAILVADPSARHHGYSLISATGAGLGLYDLLRRWHAAGVLCRVDEDADPAHIGRPPRRYYTVTPAGLAALTELIEGKPRPEPRARPYEYWSALIDRSDPAMCWPWPGKISATGYPNRTIYHRAYTDHHGPIPTGQVVDHNCHNLDRSCPGGSTCPHRACVNPHHLRAVTHAVNVQSGRSTNGAKTHCPREHPLTPGNLYINSRGQRVCRTCQIDATRRQRAKRAAKSAAEALAGAPAPVSPGDY